MRRRLLIEAAAVMGLVIPGVIALAFVPGITGVATATTLFSLAGVMLMSLIFYEVGVSEDRERERQERERLYRNRPRGLGPRRPRAIPRRRGHGTDPPGRRTGSDR